MSWKICGTSIVCLLSLVVGCTGDLPGYDATNPARGPGQLVGNDGPITDGNFAGGNDVIPSSRNISPPPSGEVPTCNGSCVSFCDGSNLENPVNQGLCTSTWGVGLDTQPIDPVEACRRLYVDMLGRFPSMQDIQQDCLDRPWGDVVKDFIDREEFVQLNRQHWADVFLYNTQVVSVERIYDMDILVEKLVRGHVGYDLFGAVVSAHPAFIRRYAEPEDKANAVFSLLMGRPAFAHERADLGRLYNLWTPGYYDHLPLNMRLPDSVIAYRCVDEYGAPDPATRGDCTSTLWGVNELILEPDWRSGRVEYTDLPAMWSGMLSPEEWQRVQLPGRLLNTQPAYWETIVDSVLKRYMGYDLGVLVPEVRSNLVRYLLDNQGDIRSLHFAVATSVAFLQTATGATPTDHRWTYGPHKQIDAEAWLDSVKAFTSVPLSSCDHRLTRPNDFLEAGSVSAFQILQLSDWELDSSGQLRSDYADLASTLGGCPENESGGRFRIVSILTTSAQLNFINDICDPSMTDEEMRVAPEKLLPSGVSSQTATNELVALDIFSHLSRAFVGREATAEEVTAVQNASAACVAQNCTNEQFARSMCFSLLSSSELLFY